MDPMIRRIGALFVMLLPILFAPTFTAKVFYSLLVLASALGIYALQPSMQPVKVRRTDRRR